MLTTGASANTNANTALKATLCQLALFLCDSMLRVRIDEPVLLPTSGVKHKASVTRA